MIFGIVTRLSPYSPIWLDNFGYPDQKLCTNGAITFAAIPQTPDSGNHHLLPRFLSLWHCHGNGIIVCVAFADFFHLAVWEVWVRGQSPSQADPPLTHPNTASIHVMDLTYCDFYNDFPSCMRCRWDPPSKAVTGHWWHSSQICWGRPAWYRMLGEAWGGCRGCLGRNANSLVSLWFMYFRGEITVVLAWFTLGRKKLTYVKDKSKSPWTWN